MLVMAPPIPTSASGAIPLLTSAVSPGSAMSPSQAQNLADATGKLDFNRVLRATARPEGGAVLSDHGPAGMELLVIQAGSMPLSNAAPTIDVRTVVRIRVSSDNVEFSARMDGDAFPNAEVFVRDPKDAKVFILAFATAEGKAGPAYMLPQTGAGSQAAQTPSRANVRPMGYGSVTIGREKDWSFSRVIRGDSRPQGKSALMQVTPVSLGVWNAQYEGAGRRD
jgi:hypothetical protein